MRGKPVTPHVKMEMVETRCGAMPTKQEAAKKAANKASKKGRSTFAFAMEKTAIFPNHNVKNLH